MRERKERGQERREGYEQLEEIHETTRRETERGAMGRNTVREGEGGRGQSNAPEKGEGN